MPGLIRTAVQRALAQAKPAQMNITNRNVSIKEVLQVSGLISCAGRLIRFPKESLAL
jgi:hypothetical protein